MPALNADTAYRPALTATALTATAFFIISAIVLGTAIARTHRRLRWHGIAYAVFLVLFAGPGFLYGVLQPVAGFALAAATATLAVRLPRLSIGPAAGPALVRGTAPVVTA
jgi:ABC-type dipeptide/oligopeptide/nickel transport system permease component